MTNNRKASYQLSTYAENNYIASDKVQVLEDNLCKQVIKEYTVGNWVVKKLRPKEVSPIESTITWRNTNSKAQNEMLNQISAKQEHHLQQS